MFGLDTQTGLAAGEQPESNWRDEAAFDELCYQLTHQSEADVSPESEGHRLPHGFDLIPPGPLLAAALARVDRSRLNGYDLVRTLRAHERQVAHHQAQSMADTVEISFSAPGTAGSDPERLEEAFEHAADEIRAGLTLTRRSAEKRMSLASEVRERLPEVWAMLDDGSIDFSRAMVIARGVSHLTDDEAREVVEVISERAPRLTTGQLAAWIRRLCVDNDPAKATDRYERAVDDRRLWIEQTVDGTGNVHLLDIPIDKAKAIGRRVNKHMISLQRTGDDRNHDQLRADIAVDMMLGSDPTAGGRGLVDIKVDMTTLAGLDEKSAEIPGLGPVIADVARRVADTQSKAEWRVTVTDEDGEVVDIVTTSRRPTRALSRQVEATQPTCSYPGCRMPAIDCDYDHLRAWSEGGKTSSRNGGPKCRHDHILKDHGWKHVRIDGQDIWTSPMGHTYVTEKPP